MPKLGNSVEECLISAVGQARRATWLRRATSIAEIETDKATFEVTAPVDGRLLETFFDEGALVPVFTNIFVIGAPGESAERVPAGCRGRARGAAAATLEAAGCHAARSRSGRRERRAARRAPSARGRAGLPRSTTSIRRRSPALVPAAGCWSRIWPRRRSVSSRAGAVVVRPGCASKIARRMRESLASTAQYTLNASADATGLCRCVRA